MLLCSLALLGSVVTAVRAVTVYSQTPLAQTIGADPTNTAIVAAKTPSAYFTPPSPIHYPHLRIP
jgi:hypothetical protein